MKLVETLRKMALSFPEATEAPHFEKTSFRIKKKIFATFDSAQHRICVKLSESDQHVFSSYDKTAIFPVPNKWGKQGWTFVIPDKLPPELLEDILCTAYCEVAPKKLANLVRPDTGIEKTSSNTL